MPSIPKPPSRRPRRRYGLMLAAAGLAAGGLVFLLVPAGHPPAAHADAGKAAVHATTSVAVDGALAAAAARTLEASQRLHEVQRAPQAPADPNAIVDTPLPEHWLTTRRRPCRKYRGFWYCDGPLKVAAPHGEAAERAKALGLGELKTASHLLLEPPEPAWVAAVAGQARDTLRWPVDGGRLGRGYGRVNRRGGHGRRLHKGVDIACEPGTHVVAINDGIVAYAYNEVKGYGNLIMLVHADGSVSFYAHLTASYVFPGQQVRRGQVIGESGHTGLARGPHLHFEWRVRGRPRDPARRFVGVPEDQLGRFPKNSLARRGSDAS